ncbi:MAG: Tetratricopeptide 1 repeat-containing protein [Planctomycetota bacterium]|nr:Tetratricopeptide 1 repeat-containing protein [Planctomycetota bacterium]
MSISPQTTAAPASHRSASRVKWLGLFRRVDLPISLILVGLNAWWWWDARPIPNLKQVEQWIGVERETGTRSVAWWDISDVSRDTRGAIAVLRRAVRRSPHDGDARILLGRALGAAKEYRECAEQLRLVPFWHPGKPEAQFGEGMAWLQIKRARDAERAFLGYLAIDPNHPTPRPKRLVVENNLLNLYADEDRWDEAQEIIWRAHRDAEGLPMGRRKLMEMSLRSRLERADPAIALKNLREILAADPDDWEARRALARAANAEKLFDEADRAIARCLAERPKDPRAWADWLEILDARNDFTGLAAAVAKVPPEADVEGRIWKIRGRVYRQAKDYEGVVRSLSKAVELLPYDLDAHYSLAFALQMLGRATEAEFHRKRHIELEAVSKEVPEAVNGYKDVTDLPSPRPEDVKRAMLRLSSACDRMGWKRDAEGWAKAASEL